MMVSLVAASVVAAASREGMTKKEEEAKESADRGKILTAFNAITKKDIGALKKTLCEDFSIMGMDKQRTDSYIQDYLKDNPGYSFQFANTVVTKSTTPSMYNVTTTVTANVKMPPQTLNMEFDANGCVKKF